ncbi:hypothetical protein A5791_14755 [Mycobacterium sp. 852002-51163_SCH5372311]|uniref:hypothetical protein n=1 Tax=Mycobacterium sp. 852002-51163_SCH5372311 TaxID=1834097 RepID=UPI0008004152|nr:hypothetical protein [Mycobacterium sp. 852002-51163_SCH5372311]OBF91775.1 hypothetical protein A5791_14755 [Mycobacterium sp. 852002-51163_SCH5372311]
MRFAKAARAANANGQLWPRVVGAAALAVLGACGVIVLVIPSRASSPPSLDSRSNWVLASALPASSDFPADWGYSLRASLRPTRVSDDDAASDWRPGVPRARYGPPACTTIPKILRHTGAGLAAQQGVDRSTQLSAREAGLMDDDATGRHDESGPNASLVIWVVPDGPSRISNYVEWLGRCGSYQVTNYNQDGAVKNKRSITTVVGARSANGAEAAVTVTRTFTTPGSRKPPLTYHVSYTAVRGVIFECSIYDMAGPDRDLVQQRADQTLKRLRAL